MKKTSEVKHTTDYKQFKSILGNRAVNPKHVRDLAASMKKHDLMPFQPALVNEDMFVIDGQNRIAARKLNKMEVYYIVVPGLTLDDVRMLNSNNKSWNLLEFVESYVKTGHADCKILLEFHERYQLPLTTCALLLIGNQVITGGGKVATTIRDGSFMVKKQKEAEEFANRVMSLKPYLELGMWRHRDFLLALQRMYEHGAEHERLLDRFKMSGKRLEYCKSYREYVLILEDIYNYMMKKNRIV